MFFLNTHLIHLSIFLEEYYYQLALLKKESGVFLGCPCYQWIASTDGSEGEEKTAVGFG